MAKSKWHTLNAEPKPKKPAPLTIRVGYDDEVFGTVSSSGEGKPVYDPVKPVHQQTLEEIVQGYARAIAYDPDKTAEELEAVTVETVLNEMLDRMQAKRLWAEKV